jgi:hypothetical protein
MVTDSQGHMTGVHIQRSCHPYVNDQFRSISDISQSHLRGVCNPSREAGKVVSLLQVLVGRHCVDDDRG